MSTNGVVPFYILDVFAEARLAGNQLAVFPDAGSLSGDEMLALTREMNFSESTFIVSDGDAERGWDVRIFTPGGEVPFAGHPTLGTSVFIRERLLDDAIDEVRLNLGVGQVPVRFAAGVDGVVRGTMRQKAPEFGGTVAHETVAELLSIEVDALDRRFPAQRVSTGLPVLVVALRDLDAVQRARLDTRQYESLMRDHDVKAVFLFAPETHDANNDLNARMFAPAYGVAEDPATGSANGCLAAFLSHHRYFGDDRVSARVEQGTEIGRPSLLFINAWAEGDEIAVEVGGRAFLIAQGTFGG